MHALYRDHMGDDLSVVQDARISFASSTDATAWEEYEIPQLCEAAKRSSTKIPILNQRDAGLIRFLARGCTTDDWEKAINSIGEFSTEDEIEELLKWAKRLPTHWTPMGQQQIKLTMKAPIPIRTQSFKSKMGFVENEESRRYITSTPELFVPEHFRSRPDGSIKQGSGGIHPQSEQWRSIYRTLCNDAIDTYELMIQDGVAPEQARFILPQGVYVNWVWNGSLYAYAEFCNKRKEEHAQGEIQELARMIDPIMKTLFPISWDALTN